MSQKRASSVKHKISIWPASKNYINIEKVNNLSKNTENHFRQTNTTSHEILSVRHPISSILNQKLDQWI